MYGSTPPGDSRSVSLSPSGTYPLKINPSIPLGPREESTLTGNDVREFEIDFYYDTRETSARLLEIGRRKRASRMFSGESIFAFLNTMTVPAELLLVIY